MSDRLRQFYQAFIDQHGAITTISVMALDIYEARPLAVAAMRDALGAHYEYQGFQPYEAPSLEPNTCSPVQETWLQA